MFMVLQNCSLWKVLGVFFAEPTKIHYIKSISKKIRLAPTSVKNHLKTLLNNGFLLKKKSEIYEGYKANRENSEFIFYKKIYNLTILHESGLEKELKKNYPKAIILFGSYAKGEDIETSDIDIFIYSKAKKIELKKFEDVLKRKIHLIFANESDKKLIGSVNQGIILFGEKDG